MQFLLEGTVILEGLAALFFSGWPMRILSLAFLPAYLKLRRDMARDREQQELADQIKEALRALASSMQVGYAMENAWKEVYGEMLRLYGPKARICRELRQMIRELENNQTMENALEQMAIRCENEDLQLFSEIVQSAKRSGGNFTAILGSTVTQMCEKRDVDREIRTMTAGKRMEQRIMCLVPVGIVLYLRISSPEYLQVLYEKPAGIAVMIGCLAAYAAAFVLGNKIVEISV